MVDRAARTAMTNAKSRTIIKDPWYGVIASRFVLKEDADVKTMGVRILQLGKVELSYAPDFVNGLNLDELMAVIKHEIEHIVRVHPARARRLKKDVQHIVWNIAADWVINGPKDNKRIINLPDEGCYIPTPNNPGQWVNCKLNDLNLNSTTEEFVDWIFDNTDSTTVGGEDGGGIAVLTDKKGNIIHVENLGNHKIWKKSTASPEEMKNTAKSLTRAATQSAGVGKIPGHLSETLKELEKAQYNWEYILRNISGRAAGGKRLTYGRRNRKVDQFGVKGITKRNNVKLVIGVDTSGSMSTKMLQKVFAEIEKMMSKFKVTLILFDANVQSVNEYHKGDWRKIKILGRGGTNFNEYFKYIEENGLVGKCNIVLTDGFDELPEKRDYYVVWAIVGKQGKEYLEEQGDGLWGHQVLIDYDYGNDRW